MIRCAFAWADTAGLGIIWNKLRVCCFLLPVSMDIELAVETYHEGLFAFALSLAGNRDDACELTQETFCRFAGKGHQLRDQAKMKAWLFTTLYRVFLGWKRRESACRISRCPPWGR